MPELPEVEVTRLGIKPHLEGRRIDAIIVRNGDLRWPVPAGIHQDITGTWIKTVARRGKFILIALTDAEQNDLGTLMVHLGMTGTLRVLPCDAPAQLHDHIDIRLQECLLRYRDPRRFGAVLWHRFEDGFLADNRHLRDLGVEPLLSPFVESGGEILYRQTRGRSAPVKQILLAGQIVVGVGNIYASESLFRAGINPKTPAGRIGIERYRRLAGAIQDVLKEAIQKGGSTLRDFVGSDGASGYFQLDYFVYDRAGQPCRVCGHTILAIRQGQRSSFYCAKCQR